MCRSMWLPSEITVSPAEEQRCCGTVAEKIVGVSETVDKLLAGIFRPQRATAPRTRCVVDIGCAMPCA
eukprot:2793857-Amphidinium_carterae.1